MIEYISSIEKQTLIILVTGALIVWWLFKALRKIVFAIGSIGFSAYWIMKAIQMFSS